jgi:hypothetical protein
VAATNPSADHWRTFGSGRTVLGVVHNVTAATRLFDVMSLIAEDPRIEIVFTDPGSSAFPDGTAGFLASRGVRQIPWSSARTGRFDLAVAASHGETLHELASSLLIIPHGMGYNKYLQTGNRKPVFGLSDEWLLHQGRVVAAVLALSHDEQLRRLTRDSPAAAGHARVLGDLAFDQLSASAVRRNAYRRALGVKDTETLVLATSTWGPDSLVGAHAEVLEHLGRRLPADEFRVAVALHPNVWWGHSPWQVRQWLAACARAGVTVLDDVDDWRATLVAADVVVEDHGSVTFYAAALGIPVLLATAPEHTVAPDSPIGRFLRHAPRLTDTTDLAGLLRTAMCRHDPSRLADITSLTTSLPGDAPAALRKLAPSRSPSRTGRRPRRVHVPSSDRNPSAPATGSPRPRSAAARPLRCHARASRTGRRGVSRTRRTATGARTTSTPDRNRPGRRRT